MRRRTFLGAGGAALAGILFADLARPAQATVEIRLLLDRATGRVVFDPVGLLLQPGMRVRWINGAGSHTVTAYHPANDDRALRIPEAAQSWDSGYLVEPGAVFEHQFSVPGVYDYFCIPHEQAGMAGRLVVGSPTGPGARPYDWWQGERDWRPLPRAVRERLPAADAILRAGRIAAV